MIARFRVSGRFDRPRAQEATVSVNRSSGIVGVRILRQRKVYSVPLGAVAEMIVWKLLRAEAEDKRRERKAEK